MRDFSGGSCLPMGTVSALRFLISFVILIAFTMFSFIFSCNEIFYHVLLPLILLYHETNVLHFFIPCFVIFELIIFFKVKVFFIISQSNSYISYKFHIFFII